VDQPNESRLNMSGDGLVATQNSSLSDMSLSMTQEVSAPNTEKRAKRKREEDEDEEEDESNESKKPKLEERGETETPKIQEGFNFENMGKSTPPPPYNMSGMQHIIPSPYQNTNSISGISIPPMMRHGIFPPGFPYMGKPFEGAPQGMVPQGMSPGMPPGMSPGMPPGMSPGMPPGWGNQVQFRGGPPPMMPLKEYYVEVEPFFQPLLLRSPPIDNLTEKLPSSKTPVIDAFIYCAICNWGVSISPSQDRLPNVFTINDFNKYWEYSSKICSKPAPTETQVARLKALRRWFADFPGIKKIKVIKEGKEPIVVQVKQDRIGDVIAIVKKYSQIINTRCRSLVGSLNQHQQSIPMEGNENY